MKIEEYLEQYFPEPLNVLLDLKHPRGYRFNKVSKQDDYLQITGLGVEHIPQLIKILDLWFDDSVLEHENDSLTFSPVHAWRILSQLQSEEAMEWLIKMLDAMDKREEDWYLEEYPYIFSNIGPKALPSLVAYLHEDDHGEFALVCISHCICEIAEEFPEERDKAVEALKHKLENYLENGDALNAFLIDYMVTLNAVESAELMERAFAEHTVDIGVMGDWGKVKRRLGVEGMGLAPEREPSEYNQTKPSWGIAGLSNSTPSSKKKKSKRRKEKKSRKKNRRKKK